jgi:hypothetical protein
MTIAGDASAANSKKLKAKYTNEDIIGFGHHF